MKKFYVVNATACSARLLSSKQILSEYQKCVPTPNGVEPEFQYDEEKGFLFQWQYGQKFVFEHDVTPEDAYARLLQWTIQAIEEDPDETIRVFDNKQDAIEFVDFSLDCLYEADDPSVSRMLEIKHTLENSNV